MDHLWAALPEECNPTFREKLRDFIFEVLPKQGVDIIVGLFGVVGLFGTRQSAGVAELATTHQGNPVKQSMGVSGGVLGDY